MFKFTEIGIDLGGNEIKIAEADRVKFDTDIDSDLNHLKAYKSYPVNCEAYSEEYFKLLKKSIKDFAKTFKKGSLSLNISLPINKHTNAMFLNVPSVNKKDLEVGIKFEAEQALALEEITDAQFTWKIINEYPELNEYEVLLATIDRNIVKTLSQFKTIHCKVNRVMLQPILLERFAKGNDVMVDFGYTNTRIYMYKEGRLTEVDSINISGFTIEKKIEDYLKENAIEGQDEFGEEINAKNIIKKIYVANEMLVSEYEIELIKDISEVLKKTISKLIDEIKRVVRSFELQNGLNVDNVYYMGELSNLRYFPETLEAELDLQTKPLNIINKDIDGTKYDLASLTMMDAKLKDDTNFTQYIKANIDFSSIIVAILAISLSIGMAFFLINAKYDRVLNEQTQEANQQMETIGGLDRDIENANKDINRNQEFIRKIDDLKSQKKWLSDILYVIPDVTPNTIVVKKIDIVNKEVEIVGYGADYSSVGFFSSELEKIGTLNLNTLIDTVEEGDVYSVITDDIKNVSEKYKMNKTFTMTLSFKGGLLDHASNYDFDNSEANAEPAIEQEIEPSQQNPK